MTSNDYVRECEDSLMRLIQVKPCVEEDQENLNTIKDHVQCNQMGNVTKLRRKAVTVRAGKENCIN